MDQINAMQTSLSDVNKRENKRDVNKLHRKYKRNALDGDGVRIGMFFEYLLLYFKNFPLVFRSGSKHVSIVQRSHFVICQRNDNRFAT